MAPPKFGDLGKACNDVFNKGYNYGFLKVDTKTKPGTGFSFGSSASQNTATGRLFGSLELKYELKDQGLSLTEKWNTDNTLATEVVMRDLFARNFKLILDNTLNIHSNKHSGKLKAEYGVDRVVADGTFDFASKMVTLGVVGEHEGVRAGVHVVADPVGKKVMKHGLGVGYYGRDHFLLMNVTDANDFVASLHHKVNRDTEVAASAGWNKQDQTTRFGLGAIYKLDRDTCVRGKISSGSQLGIAVQHQLKPGIKATLSSLVNLQNFSGGGHKVGLGIEYEQ
jgi:voltage-dependent anion channel protein 2